MLQIFRILLRGLAERGGDDFDFPVLGEVAIFHRCCWHFLLQNIFWKWTIFLPFYRNFCDHSALVEMKFSIGRNDKLMEGLHKEKVMGFYFIKNICFFFSIKNIRFLVPFINFSNSAGDFEQNNTRIGYSSIKSSGITDKTK